MVHRGVFCHSNAESHLPTPQRLDPQDSRMDLFEQGSSESAKAAGLVSGLPEQRQKRQKSGWQCVTGSGGMAAAV